MSIFNNGIDVTLPVPVAITNGGTGSNTAANARVALGVSEGYFKYSLAGTTLTVAAQGTTKVVLPKQGTPGDSIELDLTGKSYTFDPAAYPVNMGCGITTTADWALDMPWFDYLVNIDNTANGVIMATSRDPTKVLISAHGECDFSDALASTSELQSNTVVWAVHAAGTGEQPCMLIGAHKQTYGTAADLWVITALDAKDGIGQDKIDAICATTFTFPVGQNGAGASTWYSKAGAATTLTFTTASSVYKYTINRDGCFTINHITGVVDNTDAAATTLRTHLPYTALYGVQGVTQSLIGVVTTSRVIMAESAASYMVALPPTTATPVQVGSCDAGNYLFGNAFEMRIKAF